MQTDQSRKNHMKMQNSGARQILVIFSFSIYANEICHFSYEYLEHNFASPF
jgi:hypothetical protein